MTYQFDRSQFIENGPTITAAAAIARIRKAAIYAALRQRKADDRAALEQRKAEDRGADLADAA